MKPPPKCPSIKVRTTRNASTVIYVLPIAAKDVRNLSRAHPLQCDWFLGPRGGQSLSELQRVRSCWCNGPGGVRHPSAPRSHSRTSGHFKMSGCLFTGPSVLSCIDRAPSDRPAHWTFWRELFNVSALLTRILKLTLRVLSPPRVLQPKEKKIHEMCTGSSCPSKAEAHITENSVSAGWLCIIPWGSFKAPGVIITPYFLIMSANTEKIGPNLLV